VTSPLVGCRVLVTRERPGRLAQLLEARGAFVVHVPLIEVVEPPDAGMALRSELARLDEFDWLVVSSTAGAERIAPAVKAVPTIRVGAVGTATAEELLLRTGHSADLVPSVQRAEALAEGLNAAAGGCHWRILVAQADRAETTLVDRLREGGHDVTAVIAYSTVLRTPDPLELEGIDALLLASGSAAHAWVDAVGDRQPPIVVAIGPTTAATARGLGLKVTATAADHSLDGLVTALEQVLCTRQDRNTFS
jgi:uroporphyrinogen-III synthase